MSKRDVKLYVDDVLESISAIKDFRNFIVHEHFGIDSRIVWDLTKFELAELKLKIEQL